MTDDSHDRSLSGIAEDARTRCESRPGSLSQSEVRAYVRRRLGSYVLDATAGGEGVAIYTLSDPRDIREVRYVGQTRAPARRYMQHVNSARLWLPDSVPWWIASVQWRAMHTWLRVLYRDEGRLPFMLIHAWAANLREARLAERCKIFEHLSQQMPLFNHEAILLGAQLPLL